MPPPPSQRAPEPEVLLAHTPYVRRLAQELVFDATLARDVEQETWLAALEQAPRDPLAMRGWLASIVRNMARRAWRSTERRRDHELRARPASSVPTPAEVIEREDQRRWLVEHVNALEEPYRGALVLRYLEGHEPRAIAAALGVPLETVRSRLKRGLELLRARLDRDNRGDRGAWCLFLVRGFGLGPPSAGQLAAVLLSTSLSGTPGILAMCLAASVVGVSLFLLDPFAEPGRMEARGEPSRAAVPAASAAESSMAAIPRATNRRQAAAPAPARGGAEVVTKDDLVNVNGRVRDTAGKPVAGAEVVLSRWHWDDHVRREALATGRSDARGEFALSYSKSDPRFLVDVERPEMWRHVIVSAFAPGSGPGWQALDQLPAGESAVLTLVPDAPLRGRLLDLEGQPVAGVKVSVSSIRAFEGETLDRFLADPAARDPKVKYFQPPPGHELVVESGPDGRFVIPGIGRERNVRLDLRGSTITQTWLEAVTRTVAPILYGGESGYSEGMASAKQVLHGSDFDWVVRPTRPITGVVRAAETGKPMADVTVMSQAMAGVRLLTDAVETRTDANGRFLLLGLPKGEGNQIVVVPNDEQPYFMKEVSVPDPAGMGPVEVEVELLRGLWVTGRVTDRVTKQPVNGRLAYFPFLANAAAQKAFGDSAGPSVPGSFLLQRRYRTDPDGRFRIVALPGRAIVGVSTIGSYRQGYGSEEIEGQDEEGNYAVFGCPIEASRRWPTSMRLIDPAPGATSIPCDLEIDPGEVLMVKLTDAAGNPVEHCEVRGNAADQAYARALDAGPELAVLNLGRNERRLLRIHQAERCLGLAAYVSLAEPSPVLRLAPCTTIVGRLLDDGGAPMAGVEVELSTEIDFDQVPNVVTDAEGVFRIEHVVPGVPFHVGINHTLLQDHTGILASDTDMKWGTTTDLGELRLKLR